MEEYIKLATEISGKLWKEFKMLIPQDMTKDEFWDEAHKAFTSIPEQYKGTVAEGFAIDMAVSFYLQIERFYFNDTKGGRVSDYTNMLGEIAKAMKNNPNFDFNGFFDSRQ